MPELVIFGACERAMVDNQENQLSLIGLLEDFKVTVPTETDIPSDARAPWRWAIASMWRRSPDEDETDVFEQRIEMFYPDGTKDDDIDNIEQFSIPGSTHRIIAKLTSVPIAKTGKYIIRISLRKHDTDNSDWEVVGEYPIIISHVLTD